VGGAEAKDRRMDFAQKAPQVLHSASSIKNYDSLTKFTNLKFTSALRSVKCTERCWGN
jgi:hypothetical protein